MTTEDLLKLKKDIESTKNKVAELKGRRKSQMETLKKLYGCSNLQEADAKLLSIKQNIESLQRKKEEGIAKLEEEFEL